jgi:hypothetical protein
MRRRLTLLSGLAMTVAIALSMILVPNVSAHGGKHPSLPARIDLPDGFQPEGITSGPRSRLYVGSLADGAILKVNPKNGAVRTLVAGVAGKQALGLEVDWRGRLWVAGGDDQEVRVYSTKTGRLLKTYSFPTAGFLNDLVVTRKAVYVTDSVNQQMGVIPLGWHGRLKDPSKAKVRALTGDIVYEMGFNANGIAKKAGWLVIVLEHGQAVPGQSADRRDQGDQPPRSQRGQRRWPGDPRPLPVGGPELRQQGRRVQARASAAERSVQGHDHQDRAERSRHPVHGRVLARQVVGRQRPVHDRADTDHRVLDHQVARLAVGDSRTITRMCPS